LNPAEFESEQKAGASPAGRGQPHLTESSFQKENKSDFLPE
jgi:hypothetical protein